MEIHMEPPIFEKYRRMQERFQLPQLNDLTATFKFELENDENIFDQIRLEMSDRLFSFTEKIIEPMIGGGDAFCCLFEQDMVTGEERKTLFELYKKLQTLKWENNMLIVRPDEKQTMEWIRKTWHLWNTELEGELMALCRKMSAEWGALTLKDERADYHG